MKDRLRKIEEIAEYLQVRDTQIKFWIREMDFPHVKLGGQYRFDLDDVKAFIDQKKKGFRADDDEEPLRYLT